MLYNVLVTFRSETNQRRAQRLWQSHGIRSRGVRPPLSLTRGSCGYGLELDARRIAQAESLLKEHGIEYGKTFFYD